MKVAVLGATGMLGFALHRTLHDAGLEVVGLARKCPRAATDLVYAEIPFQGSPAPAVLPLLAQVRPDVVLNAIGASPEADPTLMMVVNSLLPKLLGAHAERGDFHLIHFSTDAVFDGRRGGYVEHDVPSPLDAYAVYKFLGECPGRPVTVLRTSMVGLGVERGKSLFDWFFSQSGRVRGYSSSRFSGLPVTEIARFVCRHLLPNLRSLGGLWHLSGDPIDKLSLLLLARQCWGRQDIELVDDPSIRVDRSLDSSALRQATHYEPAHWPQLLAELRTYYIRCLPEADQRACNPRG